MTIKSLPPYIYYILESIASAQAEVKRLCSELEAAYPELEEITDSKNGWVFRQWIDCQGDFYRVEDSRVLLLKFLNREA